MPKWKIIFFVFLISNCFAETETGLFYPLEQLKKLDASSLDSISKKSKSDPLLLSKIDNFENVTISPNYIRSLLFHSPRNYLELINYNNCHIYSLIDKNLLITKNIKENMILINLKIKNSTNIVESIVEKKDILSTLIKSKCFSLIDVKEQFSQANIKKTIERMKPIVPSSENSCNEQFLGWVKNPHFPYFCALTETIKKGREALKTYQNKDLPQSVKRRLIAIVKNGENISKLFTPFEENYFTKLCDNINKPEKFCSNFLQSNHWSRLIGSKLPRHEITHRCQELLNKKKLTEGDYSVCINKVNNNPELCHELGLKNYPGLYPYYDCRRTQAIQEKLSIRNDYYDCPHIINNEGITTFNRLYLKFNPKEKMDSEGQNCAAYPSNYLAKLFTEIDNSVGWNHGYCYHDPVRASNICDPSLYLTHPKSDFSREKVVTKIMKRITPVEENFGCQFISKEEFKPTILKYKYGCYIVYDQQNCYSTNCPAEIIYNGKPFQKLKENDGLKFEHFPFSIKKRKFSIDSVIREKWELKNKNILNYSNLKTQIKRKNVIIQGMACKEHLLPRFFANKQINYCTPITFIVNNIFDIERRVLTISFPVDNNQNPRLINWLQLFSALKQFQKYQKLNMWTLYALY